MITTIMTMKYRMIALMLSADVEQSMGYPLVCPWHHNASFKNAHYAYHSKTNHFPPGNKGRSIEHNCIDFHPLGTRVRLECPTARSGTSSHRWDRRVHCEAAATYRMDTMTLLDHGLHSRWLCNEASCVLIARGKVVRGEARLQFEDWSGG